MEFAPLHRLEALTDHVRESPRDAAPIELIVRRPARDEREILEQAVLDPRLGLVGDDWVARGSRRTPDGSADPRSMIAIMNTRVLAAMEPDRARWPLAGDQLYTELDLCPENLPVGTRLLIGEAEAVVSDKPHLGCDKFAARFGADALTWIDGQVGRSLRMRGVYVTVVRGATIRTGDVIRKP